MMNMSYNKMDAGLGYLQSELDWLFLITFICSYTISSLDQ